MFHKIKEVSFWSDRFQEFHFGHIITGKFLYVANVVTMVVVFSIKYGFDPIDYIIPLILFVIFTTWIMGRCGEKLGFRKYFRQAEFKDVKLEGK